MSAVHYHVSPAQPREHLFAVRCMVMQPDSQGQVFSLPSWLRGSYMVRDFAKHIVSIRAECMGQPVAIERIDKRSLRCAPVSGELQLIYSVYAFDQSVRKAYLDLARGFFNGSSLFYCPQGFENTGFEVELAAPSDAACTDWKVATTLPALQVDARGFGRYRAQTYEELIDHPVEMAAFDRIAFDVDGIPHALVLSGRCELDRARVAADLAKICHVERELFGQEPQLDQYLFLTNVVGNGYGGLEHRSSTALITSRRSFPRVGDSVQSKEYREFLGLCSHEYFHLWNVKRITAQRFAESTLAAEAYSADLWHYEGLTSYYDDLFLLRAGLIDAATYLDILATNATRVERAPGHRVQTLADASFEAWIKYYQPDENSPNATVSYYVKGALVGLCLDLTLRLQSKATLDDVMRAAWQRWGRSDVPVPEAGLEALAQEMSSLDLRAFFDLALRSTGELPLIDLLASFGIRAERRARISEQDNGGRCEGRALKSWLGMSLRSGDTRVATVITGSPAAQAGVHAGDQLLALNGLRVSSANWATAQAQLAPGDKVELHVFRDDELVVLKLLAAASPVDTWNLNLISDANAEVLARRSAWLGV